MKRSRPDIETAISFLCAQMKDQDINYWGKLRRVLQFLSQTIGDDHLIGAENIYEILTYMDASYATHDNSRGRTGGCMTFGCGLNNTKLSKQKLDKKNQLSLKSLEPSIT